MGLDPSYCVRYEGVTPMKRAPEVALIQDLSGFGRCSATIALPVLSAMGNRLRYSAHRLSLSAHTAYPRSDKAVFLDLTDEP